jgi:hypothetical protein
MREIVFRGKSADNGEWLFGVPIFDWYSGGKTANIINVGLIECCDENMVIPETVGQFTGLTDKNGFTKIFEGDIIRLDGTIGGNIHEEKELLKDTTNLIIKGMGTSSWATTEQEAIMRGCKYAE